MSAPRSDAAVGVVLGHQAASSQRFEVGIADGRSLEVDDLVAVTTPDPLGEVVTYGVVTETHALHEGATMPSDSMVIAAGEMPGELVRTAEVQVMRVDPERWVAPHPGRPVRLARGRERELALYEDTMDRRLAIGIGRDGEPVHIDLDFLDGTKGGHVSISGISGVATKTSTALALIRLLLAHPGMRRRVRVLLFNVKGEDLLFLDHPNRRYAAREDRERLDQRWRRLGLDEPGGFPDVAFWAPPRLGDHRFPSSESRHEGVRVFGWTPHRFVLEGLLRFCFADASDIRSQIAFVEERVRGELLRRAVPVLDHPGAVGLTAAPAEGAPERRAPRPAGELMAGPFHDLDGLVAWLVAELEADDGAGGAWTGRAAPGTVSAFVRRLESAARRLRGLVRSDASPIPRGDAAEDEPPVAVVHLARLHEFAQRFVVGTLLAQTFAAKEAGSRDPIEFVVLDELNKYAPRDGDSPIKDTLVDIAQRGRSLGVILVGAQQQASLVAPEVTQNAAIRIAGRLDAAEAERSEYGWLGPAARARARLLMQGRVMVSQPSVPAPIAVEVPFPPWATTAAEVSTAEAADAAIAELGVRLLHTGDWHLGKRLYGADRGDEARAALDELAALAAEERVDAVLVSGDLLDRRLVDSAALGVCLGALERLAGTAPVLAVAGNHDDPDLWAHLAPHLARSGIHVAGRVRPAEEAVVTVSTASGPLHAALLPWPEPARLALDAGASVADARARYADRVASIIDRYADELRARRRREGGAAVLVGHLMVERARAGGGEREMTMGIAYVVSSRALPADLDYIALGHVHRPQPIPGLAAPGRYAGSPLALDFSEDHHAPSACIVEIDGDRTTHREVPLTASRPLVRLRGPLEGLASLASAHPDAWFACEVELDAPVPDLVRRVREAVPRALRVESRYAEPVEAAPAGDGARNGDGANGDGGADGRDLVGLYAEWHRLQGRALPEARARAFAAALARAEAAADPDAGD